MAHVERSVATLRIFGDLLIPDEISKLLGCMPTVATKKGEISSYPLGRGKIARHGSWRLEAQDCEPENLDHQISWLLSQPTEDHEVWRYLNSNFKVDLFCGLFMGGSNEGLSLSPATLLALGVRGIKIDLDIYGPSTP